MSSDKYIHSDVEDKIYSYWEKNELFKPKENSKKFSIVIPPPNVTGSLHMGHALNNSIQDLLVRYHRMNNYETLWQPGTDHAGIATQALVERKLTAEKIDKNEIGREKFIEKVWEWKEQYGDIIINQLKKLGCSCDWSRNAFTMDENLSKSVIKVFVDLYNKDLIYKDKKLVNWDTVLKTAISDLEVDQREVNSKIYYIRYPIDGTMFGEEYTLVAVSDYVLSKTPGNTVSNLSSTRALRDITLKHKGTYEASSVGEVNVVEKMKATNAIIGGEGNGGIIYPELHYGRDALVGVALFLTQLAEKEISVRELRDSYPDYFISKNKIELDHEMNVDVVLSILEHNYNGEQISTIDGLKIDFENGWVHLRKSNTEPVIRIYAESEGKVEANALAEKMINEIKALF